MAEEKLISRSPHAQDLTGQIFHSLTVESFAGRNKNSSLVWNCRCVCGNVIQAATRDLKSHNTKSCGCLKKRRSESLEWAAERLWSKVEKSETGCWNWIAKSADKHGYGLIKFGEKQTHASRLAYIVTYGEISGGMFVCHRCDNPRCCRPDHLFLGTQTDNMRDCQQKGRISRGTKCPAALLDESKVREIRLRHKAGERSIVKLARDYGVHRRTIKDVLQWITWKHVTLGVDNEKITADHASADSANGAA